MKLAVAVSLHDNALGIQAVDPRDQRPYVLMYPEEEWDRESVADSVSRLQHWLNKTEEE